MKLRYLIDLLLSPSLKALDQVDKYAGMVRTVYQSVDNGTENAPIKRFPVACDVTNADCANTGIYDELIPDDRYNSIVYWEEVSPMKNVGYTSSQKDFYTKRFTGTARLVFWGNLAGLGLEDCNGLFYALPDIEKILTQKGKVLSGDYEGFNYWIQPQAMVKQDINTVFGKYDYDKKARYYLYPYDFFAIDVTFQLDQCLKKGGAFPILPPIDCPNGVGPTACERVTALITPEIKRDCVTPLYYFGIDDDTDFDYLSLTQKADLTTRLCVVDNGAKYKFNYSTRLVNNDYLGFCMQVRRGSDSATLDVPFVGGVLDEAAIVTFCGASIGYVTKWYIQDSSGNDLVQTTNNEQPVIYDGAAIYKESGFPCVRFLNTGSAPTKYLEFTYAVACDLTDNVPLITGVKYTVSAASGNYWLGGVGISGGNAGVGGFNSLSPNGVFAADGMGNLITELGATTKYDFKLSSVDATIIKTNGVDVGTYARQDDMNGAFLLTRVGTAPQTEVNLAVDGALCEIALVSLLGLDNPAVARQEVEDEIVTYYSL